MMDYPEAFRVISLRTLSAVEVKRSSLFIGDYFIPNKCEILVIAVSTC